MIVIVAVWALLGIATDLQARIATESLIGTVVFVLGLVVFEATLFVVYKTIFDRVI